MNPDPLYAACDTTGWRLTRCRGPNTRRTHRGNGTRTRGDYLSMLFAVVTGFLGFWSGCALLVGLVLDWPPLVLGCLAAGVVVGARVSVALFRAVGRQSTD